jgi:hypothetical protein
MLSAFVAAGMVQRTRDGRSYLVTRSEPDRRMIPPRFTPVGVTVMTAFWVIALLLPLAVWLLSQ